MCSHLFIGWLLIDSKRHLVQHLRRLFFFSKRSIATDVFIGIRLSPEEAETKMTTWGSYHLHLRSVLSIHEVHSVSLLLFWNRQYSLYPLLLPTPLQFHVVSPEKAETKMMIWARRPFHRFHRPKSGPLIYDEVVWCST